MPRSRTIEKERAETRRAGDGNAAASHDALLNLVRLIARRAAAEHMAKNKKEHIGGAEA